MQLHPAGVSSSSSAGWLSHLARNKGYSGAIPSGPLPHSRIASPCPASSRRRHLKTSTRRIVRFIAYRASSSSFAGRSNNQTSKQDSRAASSQELLFSWSSSAKWGSSHLPTHLPTSFHLPTSRLSQTSTASSPPLGSPIAPRIRSRAVNVVTCAGRKVLRGRSQSSSIH